MNIVLVGFMGSGKTSVATELAKRLNMTQRELDLEIVRHAGLPINEIFALQGENTFRRLETEVLKRSLEQDRQVISTGGGVISLAENRKMLKESGSFCVFLDTSFEVVRERLTGDGSRPLFRDLDKAQQLYDLRYELYCKIADLVVCTDTLSINEVTDKVYNEFTKCQH